MLRVENAAVRFGGVQAVKDMSLECPAGRVTGLIGPNGAGKTTLFNIITGLQRPDSGRVLLGDRDLTRLPAQRRARAGLARTFQRLEVFGSLTVRENVLLAAELKRGLSRKGEAPSATADQLLARVGLTALADSQAGALPTGSARLLELARALATAPSVLLLDEPGSGLSESESGALGDLLLSLAADGMSVLLVEHDVELVMRVCQHVYVLDFGELLCEGPPAHVQSDTRVQAAYLGAELVTA
ncbi:MAG: amino acid/amide transporter ATP-binding protein 1, family [Frankiales bacterium]|nr:amino acid/amide transporter ATP-binding protein 1, family [Frankiales bacterium]